MLRSLLLWLLGGTACFEPPPPELPERFGAHCVMDEDCEDPALICANHTDSDGNPDPGLVADGTYESCSIRCMSHEDCRVYKEALGTEGCSGCGTRASNVCHYTTCK